MYGMVHRAANAMVLERLGAPVWDAILTKAGLSEQHFISMERYDDEVTFRLIGAISEVADLPMDALLESFGQYWVSFAAASDYGTMFVRTGSDFVAFVRNLDRMHLAISTTMPEANMPSFELLGSKEGVSEIVYRSDRDGLAPFVVGLMHGLLHYFGETGTVTVENREGETVIVVDTASRQVAA